jgi:hypothetical protein
VYERLFLSYSNLVHTKIVRTLFFLGLMEQDVVAVAVAGFAR